MKKYIVKTLLFCLALLMVKALTSCSRQESFEWGNITNFDFGYSFNCIDLELWVSYGFLIRWRDYEIDPYEGGAHFLDSTISITDLGTNDWESVIKIRSQQLRPEEVEPLRRILEENNTERWLGFVGSAEDYPLNFGYLLNVTLDTNSWFTAWGSGETPEGFAEAFPDMVNFLIDVVLRYADNPEDLDNVPSIFDVAPHLFAN